MLIIIVFSLDNKNTNCDNTHIISNIIAGNTMASDKKDKYAFKAMEVFKLDGLRLSIDEIADRIGVSKKTLYNHFNSKEDLLSYCIRSFTVEMRTAISSMNYRDLNAIEGLIRGTEEMGVFFKTLSPVFFSDLKRMYPEIASTGHSTGFGFFLENVKLNLLKGKSEKIFRREIDVELISQYFVHSIIGFFLNKVLNNSEYSASIYFRTVLDYHLNAIVTDRGRDILKSMHK